VPKVADVVIEVEGLVKRYGEILAVAGISFSVEKGEVFGLLGPNGAGKTTTVECLEGLRLPDEGTLRVLGEVPSPTNYALKARLGVQLQESAFFPRLTVAETLSTFARFYPRARPVMELLELLSLVEKRRSLVKDLSGGQKQRLAVALALVNDPQLLILDEPTAGLDPQARHALWDVIRAMQSEGKTVLITTHYMEEAEVLCRRVAIMDRGEIIALGAPAELISQYFKETAVELELSGEADLEELSHLPGVGRLVSENKRIVLYTSDVPGTLAALTTWAPQGSLPLRDLIWRRASLEDVYLALTGRRIRE